MEFTNVVRVQVKKLSEDAIVPTRGTAYSAGYDLYSPIDCVVEPHSNKLVMTNVAVGWSDPTYYMQLVSRSSIAYKRNVTVEAGVIDYDYQKNVGVLLKNTTDVPFEIKRGDRIAQGILVKIAQDTLDVVDEFDPIQSDRDGGFGSTGI